MDSGAKKTEKQILKSTFIMGGTSIINSLLGMVRTKIIALMLGPAGMGLTGIYVTITNLFGVVCGMGIGESGVRQIAGALGSDDAPKVARTVRSVRRLAFVSGTVALALLLIFRSQVSTVTFGNPGHAFDVALLSLALFFEIVMIGQKALIQGMRRIGDLAKVTLIGAVLGTIVSVPAIYFFGARGIALYLVIVMGMALVASWWYSSRIEFQEVVVTWRETFADAKPLLKLGVALMLGALMAAGTQYMLRVMIVRHLGLDAAGIYHASTTLSLVYVGIILNAMLTDFYPRLSSLAHDHEESTALMNKQVEVGLLLAVPGILGIMTFAPVVILIIYSSKFLLAVEVLKWQILGVMLQVVAWPMSFLIRARADGKMYFLAELFANVVNLSFSWLGIVYFGLPGIGMAFLGMNILYWMLLFTIINRRYAFTFTRSNIQMFVLSIAAALCVFLTPFFLPKLAYLSVNVCITVSVGIYCLLTLCGKTDTAMVPGFFLRIKARFGI